MAKEKQIVVAFAFLGALSSAYLISVDSPALEKLPIAGLTMGWLMVVYQFSLHFTKEQRKLRDHADRRMMALKESGNGLWDINFLTGKVVRSEHWGEILGYPADEQPSMPSWEQMVHPDDFPTVKAALDAHILGKTPRFQAEYRMKAKSGAWIWILDQGRIVEYEESGDPLRIIGTHRDISETKAIQSELEKAKYQADAAAMAKGEFLASMSHEIRTPMNGVIGMTELLLETDLTEDQQDMARTVRSSGDALLTIINQILDFSKIEAGKVELERVDFEMRTTLEDTLEILGPRAADRALELALLVSPAVPAFVKGDPGRLRQVITNLVGNAIKFSKDGDVTVKVSTVQQSPERTRIQIDVIDGGMGIPAEAQATLFEAFTQADRSTTRRFGGTGLGLNICRQIVELMGGKIWVKSEPGEGSTFSIACWFDASDREIPKDQVRADLGGASVLIVDDMPVNVQILEEHLRSWGMSVDSRKDAKSALALLKEREMAGENFDVALLDMYMPTMDGLQLARKIKANPATHGLPLVLLTSVAKKGDAAMAEEVGFVGYLPKPIRLKVLKRCLESVLRKDDSGRQARELITRHTIAEYDAHNRPLVLLVEDNPVNQKLACRMLENAGFRVTIADNGEEGVDAFEPGKFSAVLMDCQMPVMDGYQATVKIRELEREGDYHIPIIALTAHAMEEDRKKCMDAGMDDYLAKPIKIEPLGEMLNKWIPREAAAPSVGQLKQTGWD